MGRIAGVESREIAVGMIGVIIGIVIDNMVENMRGDAGRKIREKFIEQRIMRIVRLVKWKFVKAAHGFGVETNLNIWFATGIAVRSAGGKISYLGTKF